MHIDLSQFDLIKPPPPLSQFSINITASGFVNLNEKLKQKIVSAKVGLRIFKDGTLILLDPQEEESFKILNNGSVKAEMFTRELVKRGITLPARFEAEWNEEIKMWLGTLIRPKKPTKSASILKNNIKKPRTTGLKDMMP